nr:DUF4256 domain-containing protein [uncultured Flavobacterium sp.]
MSNKKLSPDLRDAFLTTLEKRFEKHTKRHEGIAWADVLARLLANEEKLWSLNEMEETGGEPDVVGQDTKTGAFIFFDCAAESPKGRRSTCYDLKALEERKEHKPQHDALSLADAMGIKILNEEQYRQLQELGEFDLKTSSWIETPEDIRKLGGAIFADRRYNTVFVYHNGASSYYAARGFRGCLYV